MFIGIVISLWAVRIGFHPDRANNEKKGKH
jgi:hypothetical protein